MKKLFTLFFISAFLLKPCFGQTEKLSREQMLEDINTLFYTIYHVHPDMYAVYPQELFEKHIERVKSNLASHGDIFYFFRQITPLVAKLGDGHTFVRLPFHVLDNLADSLFFPFSVSISYPDKIIQVQNDFTPLQNTIPVGAQITSINNRQANDIVLEMMKYVSGEKDFFRLGGVARGFIYRMFILYGDNTFDIEYTLNQERFSTQVNGISAKQLSEKRAQQDSQVHREHYIFSILPDKNIGIIEFNSFSDLDRFKAFLDSTFQVLQDKNIGNLIIDIRANGGGNSLLGDEFFQYISPVPFAQFGRIVVRFSDIQRHYHKTVHSWEFPNPNGIEVWNENRTLTELRENPLRYTGNVFLLTSHSTFSSAASFSWAFQYFDMGTIIGKETGGLAVTFGDVVSQTLPNSGLSYGISFRKFFHYGATEENRHGTLPDYEIAAEKALDFAIDLIMRGQ